MKGVHGNLCFAISLILAGSCFASESFAGEGPVYTEDNGEVYIPNVCVDNVLGVYQDILLKFEDDNTLRLLEAKESVLRYYIN